MKLSKTALVLVILGLTVGFAAITTTLTITGTATIRANNEDFENNVKFKSGSATATNGTVSIADDGKSITFTTNTFKSIGDTSTVNFTVENNSNYGAKFGTPAIVCTGTGASSTNFSTYINATPGTELNGQTLARGASKASSVTISMKKSFVNDATEVKYTCSLAVEAVEATS